MPYELTWTHDASAFVGWLSDWGKETALVLMAGSHVVGRVSRCTQPERYAADLVMLGRDGGGSTIRCATCALPSDAMVALERRVREELPGAVYCRHCERLELPWHRHQTVLPNACQSCAYWIFKLGVHKDERAIVDGEVFTISREFPRGPDGGMRGFAGAPFVILFDDGRQIFTTSLYTAGKIPEALRHMGPDNADFYCATNEELVLMRHVGPCGCKALPFSHVCLKEFLSPKAIVRFTSRESASASSAAFRICSISAPFMAHIDVIIKGLSSK
jgi:hypothetical protein